MSDYHYKQYIGDGVYADFDGYNIVLTTEGGTQATNRIVLEPYVWDGLMTFRQQMLAKLYEGKLDDPERTQ